MSPLSGSPLSGCVSHKALVKALVDQTVARRRSQTIIITSARMERPEPIEEIDALPAAEQRLLMEEAA